MKHTTHGAGLGLRVFAFVSRLLLPKPFEAEYGADHLATLAEGRQQVGRGFRAVFVFWSREFTGLCHAALQQRIFSSKQVSVPTQQHKRFDMLSALRHDLTYAIRTALKTPIVSFIAIGSVALGISVTVSTFSIVNSWLLRPLPYPDASRLVVIYQNDILGIDQRNSVTPANYFGWSERATSFDAWMASRTLTVNLTGVDRPEQLTVDHVTPNFFDLLQPTVTLGRTFRSDEGTAGSAQVVVLGEGLWRTTFGADSNVLGTSISLNGSAHTIIGVVDEGFDFLLGGVDMWVSTDFHDLRDERERSLLTVSARLMPSQSVEQAQAEMTGIATQLRNEFPQHNAEQTAHILTIRQLFPGDLDRGLILILMLVVGLSLLIACVNVANLLLAKADTRHRELAIRVALGAGKKRIILQLLTESVLLAVVAGVAGTSLAYFSVPAMASVMPDFLPHVFRPTIDVMVLGFALVTSIVAGLAFGITPALHAVAGNARDSLIDGNRGNTASRRRRRLRHAFVAAEFALALIILVAATSMSDVFAGGIDIDPGYNPDGILTMEFRLPEYRYSDNIALRTFYEDAERELGSIGVVQDLAFVNVLPRSFSIPETSFVREGPVTPDSAETHTAERLVVHHNYFNTMGIVLRAGRSFQATDRSDAPAVVMVNQRFSDLFFADRDAVGERITVGGQSREIVGVAQNITQHRISGLMPIQPSIYLPLGQTPTRLTRVLLKTTGDPHQVVAEARAAIARIDPDQPLTSIQTLEEFTELQLAAITYLGNILYYVGVLTLMLAAIGIYGVMAYTVSQQTGEIGIRMALGALPKQVLGNVTGRGVRLATIGFGIGVPFAVVTARAITHLPAEIPGVATGFALVSPTSLVSVAGVLGLVGVVACYLPARRATKIDPVQALRGE